MENIFQKRDFQCENIFLINEENGYFTQQQRRQQQPMRNPITDPTMMTEMLKK